MVKNPVRETPFRAGATEKLTNPLPVPVLPDFTDIQLELLDAFHEHPFPAATLMVPFPPFGVKDWLVGDRPYEQVGAGGAAS